MSASLQNYQFELGDVVFGFGAPVTVDEDGFDTGSDEPEVQDFFSSLTESNAFGVDSRQPATWIWSLHSDTARSATQAVADLRELALAWGTAVDSRSPGGVAALRYKMAGRTRVVFGRPRRFARVHSNGILYGLIPATAEFQRADTLYYGDDLGSTWVSMGAQTSVGLVSPLVSPITTLASDTPVIGTTPVIGGDVPAPFVATIHGPTSGALVNPRLSTPSWELELRTTIQSGESVTISTYPWDNSAIRSDGANLSGFFTAKSRFSKARLAIGGATLRLDGIDSSGTAACEVSWRPAYLTI